MCSLVIQHNFLGSLILMKFINKHPWEAEQLHNTFMDFVNKEEKEMRGDTKKEKEEKIDGVMVLGAGVVLLIAGVKHVLPMFLEQWRALVFLLLNLVVLSIFFTSIRSNSSNTRQTKNTKRDETDKRIKKKSKRSSKWSVTVEEIFGSDEVETVVVEQEKEELSKEELNAKVEAFIVMFKQQLAMDAQGRRKSIS